MSIASSFIDQMKQRHHEKFVVPALKRMGLDPTNYTSEGVLATARPISPVQVQPYQPVNLPAPVPVSPFETTGVGTAAARASQPGDNLYGQGPRPAPTPIGKAIRGAINVSAGNAGQTGPGPGDIRRAGAVGVAPGDIVRSSAGGSGGRSRVVG